MNLDIQEVIAAYQAEISTLLSRAIIAETSVKALQHRVAELESKEAAD